MQISPLDENDPAAVERQARGTHHLRVGDWVRVRRERWCVADVRPYDHCALLTLSGIGEWNAGATRFVLTPFDRVDPVDMPRRPRLAGRRLWRRVCRRMLANAGPLDALGTAVDARIDLLPHQLEPALAIVSGQACRLLVADDVGLGKTIQAGLIAAELLARRAAERILVLTPAGLRDQWVGELARFRLTAAVADMTSMKRLAATLPVGTNPWSTLSAAIASFDYVKRPEVLPALTACRWDLVIVDEAHGVTPASDRHRAVGALAGRARFVVLLTATPHNGDRTAFASLCGLGAHGDDVLVFRRTRREVSLGPERRVHRLPISPGPNECRMHAWLETYTRAVRAERGDRDRDVWLGLAVLHKRALSSPRSLEISVARRLLALREDATAAHEQFALPLDEECGDFETGDEAPAWTGRGLEDAGRERKLLEELAGAARRAAREDTKLAALTRLLARLRRRGEAAVVFTEYRDTLLNLRARLPHPCVVVHGGVGRADRLLALDDFRAGRVSVLLATDAAGEGLNLQDAARVIINLELPWNPVRLEQRAGRVDRIGQRRTVHAFHLIAAGTNEGRILNRLRLRLARARHDIGAADPLGEEDAVARLILASAVDEPAAWALERCEGIATPPPALAAIAAGEHARLVRARALVGGHKRDVVEPSGPLVRFTRRRSWRACLGRSALVLLESRAEDSAGRPLASHATAVTVRFAQATRPAVDAIAALVRAVEMRPWEADPQWLAWSNHAMAVGQAFWRALAGREQALLDALGDGPGQSHLLQPGLFDARAERTHRADAERQLEAATAGTARLAAVERERIATSRPRAVLVLIP